MSHQWPPHLPGVYYHVAQPYKHRPAEWCPDRRKWIQDGRILNKVKASKAFVWPKDGRRGTTWGRFKDILQNKGPDIYLTLNAEKHDYIHNRPSRARWAGHTNLDDPSPESSFPLNSRKYAPWVRRGMLGRHPEAAYDFRTRKYVQPHESMWTDAIWQPRGSGNKGNPFPEAVRNIFGEWFQDSHYLPRELGGPVDNERGRGSIWGPVRPYRRPIGTRW
ncbi:hypothetical protein IQ06DRAFT_348062 [Phaeosphaeriaceae sp. SRC1lsM3a]|nr:hypothetical protein IQ06DRAFT_348062 [Stagonospora sp. SRC1lsM3a]